METVLSHVTDREQAAASCVRILSECLPHFRWTGVYWLQGETLVLGPYIGAATEHDRIPVGRGICGTAVAENANQIVADVSAEVNYLACSIDTRAEIVVLIRDNQDEIVGQIDVDGNEPGAFDQSDEALLNKVAQQIADLA